MTLLEVVAVAFSLACVIGSARRQVWAWPAGLVGVVAYAMVFSGARLYADMGLQAVFFVQGCYGWVEWRRAKGNAPVVPITALSARARMLWAVAIVVMALGVGGALARYTDASSPYLDSLVSVMSLAANTLLARRVVDNWALWVLADVLYVGLFASKGLFLSAALYVVFLGLALAGWQAWRREGATLPDDALAARAVPEAA